MGRECRPGVWESLPFSADSRLLGRDLQPAATGFSTFLADFPDLGRDFRPTATGNLYPFRQISAVWVEIYIRRHWDSLPFSAGFRCLGRDLHPAATGISTLFGCFSLFG